MREIFVTDLVKEVLGPRAGVTERITTSPLIEYLTGVLAPVVEILRRDIDSDAEIPNSESEGETEDATGDVDSQIPPWLSPALDPRSRPSSMGLSFCVTSENDRPEIDMCITWARYEAINATPQRWERRPRWFTHTFLANQDNERVLISSTGRVHTRGTEEISLHAISRRIRDGVYFVSLFVVNRINFQSHGRQQYPRVEHHIFQPQIRVICKENTEIISLAENVHGRSEEELAFLYRDHPTLARGHLCSAMWREIDPERNSDTHITFPSCMNEPPFRWIDGDILPSNERDRFTAPHVRSEFVPIYSIPSPDLQWRQDYGESPELRAEVLAEDWDTQTLRRHLEPVVTGYSRWMNEKANEIPHLSITEQDIANRLLNSCNQVIDRMRRGIDILCTNDDARLAFCIANRALDISYRWNNQTPNSGLIWLPFQLSFILMVLESVVNYGSPDREICDLLWVPTGAGKTEAYLAIAVFNVAYRRRIALNSGANGAGVSVITRYTLRLLTIQQFRRALSSITAIEYLRVHGHGSNSVGWRPRNCARQDTYLWGSSPFSIGLWVGRSVTPNNMDGPPERPGALGILRGARGEGDPAQVLNCPACRAILAIPRAGLRAGSYTIHLVMEITSQGRILNSGGLAGTYGSIVLLPDPVVTHMSTGFLTLTLHIRSQQNIRSEDIAGFCHALESRMGNTRLACTHPSRPGYFTRHYIGSRQQIHRYDFDIICPNPDCPLHIPWFGGSPAGSVHATTPNIENMEDYPDGNRSIMVQEAFRANSVRISDRIPIPALTVDEQIYQRVPSIIISTVDKFARPSFEPTSATMFGNVEYHHSIWGYYRLQEHGHEDIRGHPMPDGTRTNRYHVQVNPLPPPELFIQDELHLIEGPLGSLVGFYETALDAICREHGIRVKYIASTATIRRAEEQVQSVFVRTLQKFPPQGLTSDDSFFVRSNRFHHQLQDSARGRLYVGICAPGRGPLLPIRNIWARLLQTAQDNANHHDPVLDTFWTLTGYFNAVRELAGTRALYRQDIQQRIDFISASTSGGNPRQILDDRCQELSSRTDSTDLPSILDLLNLTRGNNAQDALFTTSMFGTGVDIPRIGLMVVNGQPKTTSSYIQSTGRVGRFRGALVVTFLRASRPRDLNHYEFFCGYHSQLHRFVEPITVYPFAPGVVERTAGPVMVLFLRNALLRTGVAWHTNNSAFQMADNRNSQEAINLLQYFERRSRSQPGSQQKIESDTARVRHDLNVKLDIWHQSARRNMHSLLYAEYALFGRPRSPVVLGDPQHMHSGQEVVFDNAPQSMRDIEETTGFET